ncbi:MAG: hypothetical protein ACRC8S_10840 [Fimbriiglobus sp.]
MNEITAIQTEPPMIHPAQYVWECVENQRNSEVIAMLEEYLKQLRGRENDDRWEALSFCTLFLMTVCMDLKKVQSSEEADQSPYLTVWRDLAYLGISRAKIPGNDLSDEE